MIREIAEGHCIVVDPLSWGIAIRHEAHSLESVVEYYAKSAVVLSFTADYRRNVDPVRRGVYSCVSSVKAILGIRRCRAITPFGLYRWLCNNGAIMVKPWVPYENSAGL